MLFVGVGEIDMTVTQYRQRLRQFLEAEDEAVLRSIRPGTGGDDPAPRFPIAPDIEYPVAAFFNGYDETCFNQYLCRNRRQRNPAFEWLGFGAQP